MRGTLCEVFESRNGPRTSRYGGEAGSCGQSCDGNFGTPDQIPPSPQKFEIIIWYNSFVDIAAQILAFFGNNTPLVSFFGAIIGGEETLVLLVIFAARDTLNLWHIVIFFYAGVMVSDALWYLVGRSRVFNWLITHRLTFNAYTYWGKMLYKTMGNNTLEVLFMTKFLYGFRIPTIMYFAQERLSFRAFIQYSLLTNLIWMTIITVFAWFAGKGIKFAMHFSHNILMDVFLIGVVMVLFALVARIASKYTKSWLQKK